MPTTPSPLTPRLMTAVDYVRGHGHLLADIGTDHAYLPIYLCRTGRLAPVEIPDGTRLCAVASDINQGPVDRATAHIAAAGLTDAIRTVRTDGLFGLDAYAPSDIVIFGMGGELIASILAAAPWLRRVGTRLILQPMTHPEKLRAYLSEAGFAVVGERLSVERMGPQGERIYQTVCADFAPDRVVHYTAAEALVGKFYPFEQGDIYRRLLDKVIATEVACRDARRAAGRNTAAEDALIQELQGR